MRELPSIRKAALVLLLTADTHVYKYHSAYKQAYEQHKEEGEKKKLKLLGNKKMNEVEGKWG